jgi:hypothetical protein
MVRQVGRETAEDQRPISRQTPATSDSALDVLGHLQGIINVDAEVAHRRLDLAMAQEPLCVAANYVKLGETPLPCPL